MKVPGLLLVADVLQVVVDLYFGFKGKILLVHVGVHRVVVLLVGLPVL